MSSSEIVKVSEFEELAKQKLPKMVYDYYSTGAEDLWTLKQNRSAFERIRANVLGFTISAPIMVASTAMQRMAHPDELATIRAASKAGTIMALSSLATSSMEEVSSVGPSIRFFQLHVNKDRNVVAHQVRRAERAGFKAIVLTVDPPRTGRREKKQQEQVFALPKHLTLATFQDVDLGTMDKTQDVGLASFVACQIDRSLTWKRPNSHSIHELDSRKRPILSLQHVKWLQSITKLPVLIKGILTAEDRKIAICNGAAGIIVSNHSARQLDYVPATISALEVVQVAAGRFSVFLDGGVRRGTDVFKALALGASGIRRPVLFGLACDGQQGVERVLQLRRDEFELVVTLAGCTKLSDINRSHIQTEAERFRAKL
uniref:FMN hydroxy acid dehydrogenase domain-containing protein n=1 Tax=Physcomitrium patens TaxID=3218 RepID=A0A2K1JXY9_PHYPA|nr:hypothetical protein PHYPA_013512 [Physcomitrium patens]